MTEASQALLKKVYTHQGVEYGYNTAHAKWNFTVGTHTIVMKCGGAEVAKKVAGVICGGFKRTKGQGLDGLAKAHIERIIAGEVKPLVIAKHSHPVELKRSEKRSLQRFQNLFKNH